MNKEIIKTKRIFSEKYNNYNEIPDRFWLLSLLLPDRDVKILDIGPGSYVFQDLIDSQKRDKYQYHSMDLQLNNLGNWAVEHIHDANADPYPFPENSFDLIIATDVIEHIKHTDVFLKNIHRILKFDGEVLITTPNYASIGSVIKIIQGKMFHNPLGTGIDKYCFNEHVKFFTLRDLIPYLIMHDIFPRFSIIHGYKTYLPFVGNSHLKLFMVKYVYNNLVRLSSRFSPELIVIAGKMKTKIKSVYV